MSRDAYKRINKAENFLKAEAQPMGFALSPEELAALKAKRQTRKLASKKRVVGLSHEKTDPDFCYRAGESFFEQLIDEISVVCGQGSFFDPESTDTLVDRIVMGTT